jgi:hypothetical protein
MVGKDVNDVPFHNFSLQSDISRGSCKVVQERISISCLWFIKRFKGPDTNFIIPFLFPFFTGSKGLNKRPWSKMRGNHMTSTRTYDGWPAFASGANLPQPPKSRKIIDGASSESLLQYFCPQISFKVVTYMTSCTKFAQFSIPLTTYIKVDEPK